MLIIGSHVSFGGMQLLAATEEAINYKANTFMFYTGAPTNTIRVPIDEQLTNRAKELMLKNGIDINNVICHAPYIVNPATNDQIKQDFTISFLKQEISRCATLGVKYIVLHPGSAVGVSKEVGLDNIVYVLDHVLDDDSDVKILLETMSGKGNECGTSIQELSYVIKRIANPNRVGVCIDTCHINDVGVDIGDIEQYLDEFDKEIGIKNIGCIHCNDSKNPISSHKDRHANFGFGTIGFDKLIKVIYNPRLDNIPKILETPYIGNTDEDKERLYPPYKFEIEMIRSKTFDKDLLNKIRLNYKR